MPRAVRAAKNESLFRDVNERILELEQGFGVAEQIGFVCECSRLGCTTAVQATVDEYRRAHDEPTHFLIAHGHIDPDYERIVLQTERFTVVEKLGLAGLTSRRRSLNEAAEAGGDSGGRVASGRGPTLRGTAQCSPPNARRRLRQPKKQLQSASAELDCR